MGYGYETERKAGRLAMEHSYGTKRRAEKAVMEYG